MKVTGMRRIKGVFGLVLLIISFSTYAQDEEGTVPVQKANGILALQIGIPTPAMQQAIKNNMGNMGFGVGFSVLTNPFSWGRNKRNSPLRIGGEVGYTYYGRFLTDVNIGGFGGNYKTSYGILQANAIIQLRLKEPEFFTPFIEGLVGGSFYISTTKENLSTIESGLGIQPFDFGSYSSASFNKGVALGAIIGRVKHDNARLAIRLSYNWGTRIRYVIRNSLAYDPSTGQLQYYVGEAPVKYFMVQVGIGI